MFKIRECKKLMKKCNCCGGLKFTSDFRKCSRMKDGYRNRCKACEYNKAKSRYLLVCLECGKEFTSKHKGRKYCSVECRAKSQCNREEVLCDYCGKSIKLSKKRIKNCNHHFCSTECHGKWKTGKNHPKWNPNLTDEDRQDRKYTEGYNDFRKQVLERDNYTCQLTGKRNSKLEVHHLKCYSDFKEERTNLSNGITLSKEIHRLFHKIYGNKHNTKEQFEEFKHRYHNKEFEEVV